MNGLNIPVIHGSAELNKMVSGSFSELTEDEKAEARVRYAERLSSREDSFISDGHYSFLDDVVFTEADAGLYDVFIYLYCEPSVIRERLQSSPKNKRFSELSHERIKKWQSFEIEALRNECHKRNKDFYVISDVSSDELNMFIQNIENGFSSFLLAGQIVERIRAVYPLPCDICICDGDKTVIRQDSFRVCSDNYRTHVFDGNFYTGFQSMRFGNEIQDICLDLEKLRFIEPNDRIYNDILTKNHFIVSSGVSVLWERLSEILGLKNVIADTLISADTKYFIVKLLQEDGYTVTAYGDSKSDLYMLKQADKAYLCIGERVSSSLVGTDTSGIKLIYDKAPYILEKERPDIAEYISVCRSDSGINGAQLANAHITLGQTLGQKIKEFLPSDNTAILVLERGGRFFGDGLYTAFGGTFYSYNSKEAELPNIYQDNVIITDSVVNTGSSVLSLIDKLKHSAPNTEIFVAANVVQKNALELLRNYKLFTVRTSDNYYVGSRQTEQKNGKGPDTADRLFNYIK